MYINPRLKTTIVTFASLGIKFLFPLILSYEASDKDFSFLTISFNLVLMSGYVFSLEHFTFYHRKAIHNNNPERIDFLERIYFDQTLVIKLLIVTLTLLLFNQFSILQRFCIFFIIFLDLHIVENVRKGISQGNYFKSTCINCLRISLPPIFFFILFFLTKKLYVEYLLYSILISFILIRHFYRIRICNFYKLRFKLNLFFKITLRTREYAIISILGLLMPLVDKLILLNFKEYNMIQTISLWAIIGNLISLFIFEYINKPNHQKIINFINFDKFKKIFIDSVKFQITLISIFLILLFFLRVQIENFLNPSIELNFIQIVGCIFITSLVSTNSLLTMCLYGHKKDTFILLFTFFEFAIKNLITISTIVFLQPLFLPYTLSFSALTCIFFKYLYFKKILDSNSFK